MCEFRLDVKSDMFHYVMDYETLGLTSDELARGMGYAGGVNATHFGEDLDRLLSDAVLHARIEGGFRVFASEQVAIEREGFCVDGLEFETGRIIAGPLRGSETLAIFVATAGAGITAWSRRLMQEQDYLQAYFVDALGSELVEKAADWLEGQIIAWAGERGQATTNRYSPGYCGWSVAEQHNLFSFLPDEFCGISLTESALMQPEKSVSGVVGIGGKSKKRAYGCSICTLENCFRRHAGVHSQG